MGLWAQIGAAGIRRFPGHAISGLFPSTRAWQLLPWWRRYCFRPGQFFDQATYLHYNYFLDYDPRLGRYIESDPIGLAGGINTYAYGSNDPLGHIDALGTQGAASGAADGEIGVGTDYSGYCSGGGGGV
jgi:RHS repeat-associated protein